VIKMPEPQDHEMENDIENNLLEIRKALVSGQFDKLPDLVGTQQILIKNLEDGRVPDKPDKAFLTRLKAMSDANLRLTKAALDGLAQARKVDFSSGCLRCYGPLGESRFLSTRR